MSVAEAWAGIGTWLAANAPAIAASLRPPAANADILAFQAEFGAPLPTDLVESLRIHDGQERSAPHGLFPAPEDVLGPVPSHRVLAVAEIEREWGLMKDLLDGREFVGLKVQPDSGVRADWWHTGWVPVADNGGGDYFCVDTAPADGGTPGQVILFRHDSGDRPVLAASFGAWLAALAAGLAGGVYGLAEPEGIV